MGLAVATGFFLYVILGATDFRAPVGFAPIAIGLSLTLIHLISIPIDNTSVNPGSLDWGSVLHRQRCTGPAVVLLVGSDHRCGHCRCDLRHHHRGAPRGP